MRQGFTNIPNELFDLDLKANELGFCVWILSHSLDFKITVYRITQELNMKQETAKDLIERLKEKLYFCKQDIACEILKRLSKIGYTISKNGQYLYPKMDSKNTKELKENTKEFFSPNTISFSKTSEQTKKEGFLSKFFNKKEPHSLEQALDHLLGVQV